MGFLDIFLGIGLMSAVKVLQKEADKQKNAVKKKVLGAAARGLTAFLNSDSPDDLSKAAEAFEEAAAALREEQRVSEIDAYLKANNSQKK